MELPDGESFLCDENQIESFVKAFNGARLFRNDWGTTDPLRADVLFADGTHLVVWGGSTQGFCGMVKTDAQGQRGEQQNIQGAALDEWFSTMRNITEGNGDVFPIDTAKPNSLSKETVFGAQYIRTNGNCPWMHYPCIVRVTAVEELEEYYHAFAGIFDLEPKTEVYSDTTIGWLDAVKKYDQEWFEQYALFMVILEEGSGSIRHKVKDTVSRGDNNYLVIERIIPEVGTTDMAEWHIMIELMNTAKIDGVMTDENGVWGMEPVSVKEMIQRFNDFIVSCAKERLSPADIESVLNMDMPIIERLDYATIKTRSLNYFYGTYDPGYDEAPIWTIQFNTTKDAILGPITYYVDSSGYVFASDYRE